MIDYALCSVILVLMYSLQLFIPILPKRVNQTRGQHWSLHKKEADNWHRLLTLFTATLPKPDKPLPRAKLTLTRYSSAYPDYDGLVSSFKHVIDAITKIGVIEDDSMRHIGMPEFKHCKVSRKEQGVRIEVYEAL